jgi:hypothetical protein
MFRIHMLNSSLILGSVNERIYHGIHRNLKHVSAVACIWAAGEHVIPFFVCSQVNDTLKRRLKPEQFRMGVGLRLKRRSKPSMNSQLVTECISTALSPYIDEL